jgi:DNA-binding XRE family transcriptional regulator
MSCHTVTTNRLQELYEREGLSRAAVADFCGVRERTVERWEKEDTGIPDDQKRRLCRRFKVSAEHLMGWDRTEAAA